MVKLNRLSLWPIFL